MAQRSLGPEEEQEKQASVLPMATAQPVANAEGSERFDALVRSERYFTATLLPAILLAGRLEGLDPFLGLLERKAMLRDGQPTERGRNGRRVRRESASTAWSPARVEIITEFHIARDLAFARRLGSPAADLVSGQATERERRDAPDLVVVLDDELVVCEGKFFDAYRVGALNAQLASQRRQIRYLFALRPELHAYRHVALLPVEPADLPDCDVLLTWGDIAGLSRQVLGLSHYVTTRLEAAVARYRDQHGAQEARNYESTLTLAQVLEQCRVFGNAVQVGHEGGEVDLARRSLDYLQGKPWKWRDPATNAGRVRAKNWIPGARFVALVEQRRGEVGG